MRTFFAVAVLASLSADSASAVSCGAGTHLDSASDTCVITTVHNQPSRVRFFLCAHEKYSPALFLFPSPIFFASSFSSFCVNCRYGRPSEATACICCSHYFEQRIVGLGSCLELPPSRNKLVTLSLPKHQFLFPRHCNVSQSVERQTICCKLTSAVCNLAFALLCRLCSVQAMTNPRSILKMEILSLL